MLEDVHFHLYVVISETDQAPVWQILTVNRKKGCIGEILMDYLLEPKYISCTLFCPMCLFSVFMQSPEKHKSHFLSNVLKVSTWIFGSRSIYKVQLILQRIGHQQSNWNKPSASLRAPRASSISHSRQAHRAVLRHACFVVVFKLLIERIFHPFFPLVPWKYSHIVFPKNFYAPRSVLPFYAACLRTQNFAYKLHNASTHHTY